MLGGSGNIYLFCLGVALKSTAVLITAWLGIALLKKQSAASRHLVWTTVFAALLVLPIFTISLPVLRVPFSTGFPLPAVLFHASSSSASSPLALPPHTESTVPVSKPASWIPDWRISLMLLWAAGTVTSLALLLIAWARMWRIRRQAKPFPFKGCASLARLVGLNHQVEILQTRGSMPLTFGLLRPAIFLPKEALNWDEERQRVVVLHELAHVRRRDSAVHLMARTALSLYWWNPLAWIGWREFLKDRERATDDLVLNAGARASDYATHLLQIASGMQSPRALGPVAVAMARRSQLEGRLLAILDADRNRKAVRRTPAVVAALLAITTMAPLSALRAQNSPSDTTMSAVQGDVDAAIQSAQTQKNPEMLDHAAAIAQTVGKYEAAEKLLNSSLALKAQLFGSQSISYGTGLVKLGDLERQQKKSAEAREFYTKALSVLGTGPEAANALIHLGTVELENAQQAMHDFEQARSLDASKAGEATLWMAIAQQHQKSMGQADSLYQSALALEDPNSSAAALTMELYAQFLRQQGKEDESKSMQEQAAAVWQSLGAQSGPTVSAANSNVYRVGGDVKPPVVITKIEPRYPVTAKIAKYQGAVAVYAEIGLDGRAHNIKVVRGGGLGLDQEAADAISAWTFKPGVKDGQPVTVAVTIKVDFRLL